MHKSGLAGFIIDCKTDDLEAAVRFWAAALGLKPMPTIDPADADYVRFEREPNGLDIETDDVDAEVARLGQLGAKRVQKINTWWVMEAPTGQRFCVVRASRSKFAEEANLGP